MLAETKMLSNKNAKTALPEKEEDLILFKRKKFKKTADEKFLNFIRIIYTISY